MISLIGYWIRDLKDEVFIAPQEIVGFMDPETRSAVAAYLDAGVSSLWRQYFGASWCRCFCGARGVGASEFSDGVWAWPSGLSHYVREHGVVLPSEFIEHAIAEGLPRRPKRRDMADDSTAAFDEFDELGFSTEYWRRWSADHRSKPFVDCLRQARLEADVRAEAAEHAEWQIALAEQTAKHGLGDEQCAWASCDERVLAGTSVCAKHYLGDWSSIGAARCYRLTPTFMQEASSH